MSPDIFSLILSAPDDEANFLSLPYIEELIYWFKWSYSKIHSSYPFDEGAASAERWGVSATAQIASLVRSRVEAERYFEKRYFDDRKRAQALNNPPEAVARPQTSGGNVSTHPERILSASAESKARHNRPSSSKIRDVKPCTAPEQPEKKNEPLATLASLSQPPLGLLWIGLFRALGFPLDIIRDATPGAATAATSATPTPALVTEEDLVLGRKPCFFSAYALDPSKDAPVLGYALRDADALRYTTLIEWFEDVLAFIVDQNYACQQARCVLLDAFALLRWVEGLPAEATEAAVAQGGTALLTRILSGQACPAPTHVSVPHTLYEPITGQMRDPKLTASIEHRLQNDKKLDKRQRLALMEVLENAPLHVVTLMEPRRVERACEIAVGPYFDAADVETVLEFLVSSVVTHWRLFSFVLSQPQEVEVRGTTLVLEDTLPCFVPPLAGFVSDGENNLTLEVKAPWCEAPNMTTEMFDEMHLHPIKELEGQEVQEQQALMTTEEAISQNNQCDALSQEQCKRVERAFSLRLQRTLAIGPFLDSAGMQTIPGQCASSAATAVNLPATPAASSGATPPPDVLPQADRPKLRQQKEQRRSARPSVVFPPLVKQQTDKDNQDSAPFVLEEVVKRVEKISASVEEGLAESAAIRVKSTTRRK